MLEISFSMTETDQFRRLVEFKQDVAVYADLCADEDLQGIVLECDEALRQMHGETS